MIKNASPILAALKVAANSEQEAVAFMEQQRWGDAPACPRCGDASVYKMMSGSQQTTAGALRRRFVAWTASGWSIASRWITRRI